MSNETIGALVLLGMAVVKFLEKMYDNWRADKAAKTLAATVAVAAEKVATKVEQVQTRATAERAEVKTALNSHNAEQAESLGALSDQLATVTKQTNGLMEKIEAAVFAKGVKSETDKGHGNGN